MLWVGMVGDSSVDKGIVGKPDDLGSIPRAHMVGEEN